MSDASKSAPAKPLADAVIPVGMFLPFALVTTLFALWGFANDVTNPLVRAFQEVFLISSAKSGLVQTAFYGGYATMAIPAAIFIRRVSYKAGILVGLGLAFGLQGFLQSLLFEISGTDPLTFGVVTLILLAVAAVASYLPARRASNLDPVVALREE